MSDIYGDLRKCALLRHHLITRIDNFAYSFRKHLRGQVFEKPECRYCLCIPTSSCMEVVLYFTCKQIVDDVRTVKCTCTCDAPPDMSAVIQRPSGYNASCRINCCRSSSMRRRTSRPHYHDHPYSHADHLCALHLSKLSVTIPPMIFLPSSTSRCKSLRICFPSWESFSLLVFCWWNIVCIFRNIFTTLVRRSFLISSMMAAVSSFVNSAITLNRPVSPAICFLRYSWRTDVCVCSEPGVSDVYEKKNDRCILLLGFISNAFAYMSSIAS